MHILRSLNDLQCIKNTLDLYGHPTFRLPPSGVLRSTLKRFWAYEAVVDQLPRFKALILRPNYEQQDVLAKSHQVFLYSENPDVMRDMLKVPGVLPWNKHFFIPVCNSNLRDVFEEATVQNGGKLVHSGKLGEAYMWRNREAIRKFKVPKNVGEFTFGPLKEEHTDMVLKFWMQPRLYKDSYRDLVRAMILHHPTACAYNAKGEPVSWALCYFEGQVGMAYTLPEYRGKRIYGIVGALIGRYMYEAGIENPFAVGDLDNTAIQKAVDKNTYTLDGHLWMGDFVPPNMVSGL